MSSQPASTRHALGAMLAAAGLLLLLIGGGTLHERSATQELQAGAVLGHDRHVQRLPRAIDSGRSQAGLGLVLLIVGGVIAGQATSRGAGTRPSDIRWARKGRFQ